MTATKNFKRTLPSLGLIYFRYLLAVGLVFITLSIVTLSTGYRFYINDFINPKKHDLELVLQRHRTELLSGHNDRSIPEIRSALTRNQIAQIVFTNAVSKFEMVVVAPFLTVSPVFSCQPFEQIGLWELLSGKCVAGRAILQFGESSLEPAVTLVWNENYPGLIFLQKNWSWLLLIAALLVSLILVSRLFLEMKILTPILSLKKSLRGDEVGRGPNLIAQELKAQSASSRDIGELSSDIANFLIRLHQEQQYAAELRVGRAKIEIARRLAHDIRSPLGALNLAIDKAKRDGGFNDSCIDLAKSSIKRINDVADDILTEASDSKTKRIGVIYFAEDLRALIDEINFKLSETELDFDVQFESGRLGDCFVNINPGLIVRAVGNLVNNAIRAVEKRSRPSVFVKLDVDEDQICIKVGDNGVGMDQVTISRLGRDELSGWSTSLSHELFPSGAGLGVAMVFRIIKEIGGSIQVTSQVGAGSLFTILIPLSETSASVRTYGTCSEV